ncbi:hypothetical protein JMJ77_0002569 [Colletotrichum scovillei]|uniref:Uncharacterized protein n=1 Tax=Colletotrichum scovillei TaxID=1209932 RepID=A0A9P7R878_9PEZI|nr:hypothetical protein JMJ77_0002569 [Colletotrichum scovillei]KAG7070992.1 hypothetical protein JMJ76_0002232 [Colletotrichum scovillei]KAG7079234.1 hypothetical protein JMJ78_0002890 [Colletotrichum scovillei]
MSGATRVPSLPSLSEYIGRYRSAEFSSNTLKIEEGGSGSDILLMYHDWLDVNTGEKTSRVCILAHEFWNVFRRGHFINDKDKPSGMHEIQWQDPHCQVLFEVEFYKITVQNVPTTRPRQKVTFFLEDEPGDFIVVKYFKQEVDENGHLSKNMAGHVNG